MTSYRWMILLFVVCLTWNGAQSWWSRRRRRCATHSCKMKWSECSKTCGGGTRYAIKTKEQGACGSCNMPIGLHPCNTKCCPANCQWTSWKSWSSCSRSCGGMGVRTRRRNEIGPTCGGRFCRGASSETRVCYTGPCPIHCSWGPWKDWTSCSSSCGRGSQYRSRTPDVKPLYGGKPCLGDSLEKSSCNRHRYHGYGLTCKGQYTGQN